MYLKTTPGKHSMVSLLKSSCTTDIAHNRGSAAMCTLKLEAGVVGCTIGPRREVPAERKLVIRNDGDDGTPNNNLV
jgi:purine nucleoside phosphorylase